MAEAYALATDLADPGAAAFNVGSGQSVSVAEILDTLIGLARIPVRAELDAGRVRPGVTAHFALDSSRFRARTGWSPKIPLQRSLEDTLEYWRGQVKTEAGVGAPGRGATA
jgi:GDP-4-dehydro-6-deoxy-D-mannose reductase